MLLGLGLGVRPSAAAVVVVRIYIIETTLKRRFLVEMWQQLSVAPDPHVGSVRVIYKSIQTEEPSMLAKFKKKLQKHLGTSCRAPRSL